MERSSGVLLAVTSLPSKYGIGTLGREAFAFADFLKEAGQKYWQVLPLGPTGLGDSPYSSFSTFAGNPYLIDLELLIEDGLLTKKYVESFDWGDDPAHVDYVVMKENRETVLQKAFENGFERDRDAVDRFVGDNVWLPDYALFMALREYYEGVSWIDWDDRDIRLRKPEAIQKYRTLLADRVNYYTYVQYLFFKQWNELREYVKKLGIKIIGDLPIYVAADSADIWREPQFFQLDEENIPKKVAGVPPDYFSKDGQLWGNPLYDCTSLPPGVRIRH